ncbi:MAG: InlB B-repeat-containing protein [Clostridia bacterium]|nr:InlB B-repeat-containing protein [Clostridia bacterium]
MTKIKQHSRQIFVILLALATVATCFFIMSTNSNAATAGTYDIKFTIYESGDGCNGEHSYKLTYKTKSNNGNGTESSEATLFDVSDVSAETYSATATNKGFPSYVYAYVYQENLFSGGDWSLKVEVTKHGGSSWKTVKDAKIGSRTSRGSVSNSWNSFDNTPAVSSISPASASEEIVLNAFDATGDTTTTKTINATVYDQYGVTWYQAPTWSFTNNSTYSVSCNRTSTTTRYDSATLTFGKTTKNGAQKTAVLKATCGTVENTYTYTVTPTYKLFFDINDEDGDKATWGSTGSDPVTTTNTSTSGTTVTQTVSGRSASRPGFDFLGWAASSTANSGSTDTITGRSYTDTVYAVWSAHKYQLRFNGNDATSGMMSNQEISYDDTTTYTGADGGTAITNNGFKREYTVSYDGNEGTVGATSDANTKAAYGFAGWYSGVNDNGTYSGTGTAATGTYTEIKQWEIPPAFAAGDVYRLEFDAYGTGNLITYFYGAENYLKVASSETTVADGTPVPSSGNTDGNVTYALTSTQTHYTTKYTLGSTGDGSVIKYLLFRVVNSSDTAHISNVRFIKESGIQFSNQQKVINLTKTDNTVFDLFAAWTPKTVTLPGATREAWDFDGWYTAAQGGTKIGDEGDAYTPVATVTLFAHWTPKTYTITLKDGYSGTTVGEPIEYTILTTNITYPDAPTRDGYNFNNKYTVQSDSGNWHAGDTLTNNSSALSGKYGNVILNAGWTPKTYTVTYKAVQPDVLAVGDTGALFDGFTADVERTYTYDAQYSDVGMPDLTIPTGYTFGGWYYDEGLNNEFLSDNSGNATVQILNDTTVYPKWEPVNYEITYILNDGDDPNTTFNGDNPQSFNVKSTFSAASASRQGYEDAVWQVISDTTGTSWGSTPFITAGTDFSLAYGNVTLSAQWTAKEVQVLYAGLADGSAVDAYNQPVSVKRSTYNNAIGVLATGVRDGYRFDGWFMQDGTNGVWGDQVTAASVYNSENGFNTVTYKTYIYAKWTPRTYTVAFDGNGQTAGSMDTQTFAYDEAAKALNENRFARTGYDMLGWALSDDATAPDYTDKQQIRINGLLTAEQKNQDNVTVTLYAVWAKHPYTVTWLNLGNVLIDTTEVEYEGNPTHSVPTYSDDMYVYDFRAWTKNGADVDLSTEVITADTTYVAAYDTTARTYNLIYRAEGEGETAILFTDSFQYGTQTSQRAVPEKTGYTGAWRIIDPADMQTVPTLMPAYNITLKAVYTPIKYLITWDLGAGVTQTQRCDYDSVPVYSGTPTRPDDAMYRDYSFIGWSATGEDGTVLDSLPVVKGDTTYYAVYSKEPVDYEIYWYQDYEDAEHNISHHLDPIVTVVPYGTTITDDMIPAITPVTGCAVAWDITALPQTMPAEDVYIEAVYRYGARNIYWHNGATTASTVQMDGEFVKYTGATPVKAATAEYSYTFIGWARVEDGAVVFDSRENDTSTIAVDGVNLDFYAVFESNAKEYTVYYYVDGGVNRQFTVAYGGTIPTYPVPAKEGHTGLWGNIPDTMPAHDVTIEANYSKNSYRVTWAVAGRVVTTYSEYGDKPVFPSTESKVKAPDAHYTYEFSGWATVEVAVDGDLIYSDADIPPIGAAEVVYYAQYESTVNSYTVTWKVDEDESHDITSVYNYGETPQAPPASATARPSDAQYDYTFTGWDKEISSVEGDTTYVAQYDKQIKSYTVTWIIRHGSVDIAEVSESYEYGIYPIYTGTAIQDYEDAGYDYVYEGAWATVQYGDATDDLPAVTEDATYFCHFRQIPKQFYIEWIVDGSVIDSGLFNYGESFPQRDIPEKEGYSGSWNVSDRTVPARDVTVTAQYKANKYPVVFIGLNGVIQYSDYLYYGDPIPAVELPVEEGYTLKWDQPEITTVPVDGVTFNLIRTINTYTLRWKNDNNDTGFVTADYHTEINVTITAPIPEEMVVVIGDVTATEGTEFTYDPATGALKVFAQYVTADINAYSKARGNSYNVYIQIPDVEIAAAQEVVEAGATYYAILTAIEGKLVPAAVTVMVDGEPLTRGYQYMIEQGGKTARLAIDGSAVSGTVTVQGEVRDDPNYGQGNGGNSGNNSGNSGSSSGECPYCHGHHEGFLGVIISFFHRIMYFFKSIFG